MPLTVGNRLGPYEIVSALGVGGMGIVYRASDPRLGREVAIKVLPAAYSADADRLRRFEQEARAAAALNHPNILAVYDVGTHDGAPYIVSELLEGQTLRNALSEGALPVKKGIDYAVQTARGLAAAHDKGIVHRDLKPENLFVTVDGRIKILDFGLAKLTQAVPAIIGGARRPDGRTGLAGSDGVEGPHDSALPTMAPPTLPGMVLGTVGYMAPEQVRGLEADHRADLFAFGAILYEMLTGQRAFHRDTTAETMTAILKEDPPEAPLSARHVPPALMRIVDHCLERNPAARFQATSDLAFALEALSSPSTLQQSAAAEQPRVRRTAGRYWMWLAASAMAVLLISAPFAVRHLRETVAEPPVIKFLVDPGPIVTGLGGVAPMALSPDGSRLVFAANSPEGVRLMMRPLNSVDLRAIEGTQGAT